LPHALLGAAELIRAHHYLPISAIMSGEREATRQRLRDSLGEHRLTTATATGRLSSLELLVDEAEMFAEAQPIEPSA
jgi:hypothetical protein